MEEKTINEDVSPIEMLIYSIVMLVFGGWYRGWK